VRILVKHSEIHVSENELNIAEILEMNALVEYFLRMNSTSAKETRNFIFFSTDTSIV